MGNGIAHVAALSGSAWFLSDIDQPILDRALKTITGNLDRQVKKGVVDASKRTAILERITTTTHLREQAGAQLVVEAAVESFPIKAEIFRQLDQVCPPTTIFASNTSSISITKLAAVTSRGPSFIGMHFMNPVPMMQLVEVIRGLDTSDETYETIRALAEKMGKTPVCCNDFPGFVANRVLMPMINEAIYAVYHSVATPEAVDQIMKLGMNHPMGPLTPPDFIGLTRICHHADPARRARRRYYQPCPLLVKMVDGGRLGRSRGVGFYNYAS
jgi:3-hydroxybutyryl-CoA dehydrogenase